MLLAHTPHMLIPLTVPVRPPSLSHLRTSLPEVVDALGVDREEAHGSAVLGTHVGYGRPVRDGELAHSRAEKLDKLARNAHLTQMLPAGGEGEGRSDDTLTRGTDNANE